MPKYQAVFHIDDARPLGIAITAKDEAEVEVEELLAGKMERRLESVDTDKGPVLYPARPRFACFPAAKGDGFTMIPVGR
ncbi:hypothetical protein [Nocardiopsis valliformis]|uniref:hypothetical protein n=1 Tax=Nocardiopsis valliformis TaxID=239974 RepID=UPI00035F473A|nr:hypothetical protein [Nocardiopsis valliformis]